LVRPVSRKNIIKKIYEILLNKYGPQKWWPGDTPFEVCIGAILTQNTSWKNVEKAISNLKKSSKLKASALRDIPAEELACLIKPAGYYNQKAKKLKNFINFLFEKYNGRVEDMKDRDANYLREELLSIKGIGKETADSILLYALEKPVFVVDAYTYRIAVRHNLVGEDTDYDELQRTFVNNLDVSVSVFNEYHALLVRIGKEFCKKKEQLCKECPLSVLL